MKRAFVFLLILCMTLCVNAIPAKRKGYTTIRLTDGREVLATLVGDEYLHYMQAEDGQQYIYNSVLGGFEALGLANLKRTTAATRSQINQVRRHRRLATAKILQENKLQIKKALLLLVQFPDKQFLPEHTPLLYENICNTPNFQHELGFKGSVKDYFKAQSNGLFDLSFDVKGPINLSHSYAYYGENNKAGEDIRPEEMVKEACRAVEAQVDFADYDWNHDSEVDALYILYAGQGENTTYKTDPQTIWPHQSELSSTNDVLTLDGVTIRPYACSAELIGDHQIDGIGTICHEFSHLLGLPDMYDTVNQENYGMCTWDIMDQGAYNGNAFVPAGYTSYERMFCDWMTPHKLTKDTLVQNVKPLSEGGESYILYNDGHLNEYYLLENRAKTKWDAYLDGEGLLVLHVDYDAQAWSDNEVNTDNSHQRCTIFHADGSDRYLTSLGMFHTAEVAGDPYPYKDNNCLTATSQPAANLFHANAQGSMLMDKILTNIQRHTNGTVSFQLSVGTRTADDTAAPLPDGVLFHETFNQCHGTGGNSGGFHGRVATQRSQYLPDVQGWTVLSGAAYGGDRCARFGLAKNGVGIVFSPSFMAIGTDTLIFVAAPFGNDGNSVDVYINEKLLDSFPLQTDAWTTISAPFEGKGATVIKFVPDRRLFLDDVKVVGPRSTTSGIQSFSTIHSSPYAHRIYNLHGQYMGDDLSRLPQGIYVINGRKILK